MSEENKETLNETVRSNYIDAITKLILGPGSEKINNDIEREIISEKPESRYVTGVLYPEKSKMKFIQTIETEDDVDVEVLEEKIKEEEQFTNIDNNFFPSSLGITFYCENVIDELEIIINTAMYETVLNPAIEVLEDELFELHKLMKESQDKQEPDFLIFDFENKTIQLKDSDSQTLSELFAFKRKLKENQIYTENFILEKIIDINKKTSKCFQREPLKFRVIVDLNSDKIRKEKLINNNIDLAEVFIKNQKVDFDSKGKTKAITIVMKNISDRHLFQSEIIIGKQEGIHFKALEEIEKMRINRLNDDDAMNLFLYRDKKTYAFGRGVSANWKLEEDEVSYVKTTYIPIEDIVPMSFTIPGLNPNILSPNTYVHDSEDVSDKLSSFVSSYDKWIEIIESKSKKIDIDFQTYAQENIRKCKICSNRMKKSIAFLEVDSLAKKAFIIANEAMILQRISNLEEKLSYFKTKDYSKVDFSWRPFQLAFILNSLESILNEQSTERETLDLIWVSTGGGKTEAYLFAIAILIIYRRLRYPDTAGGVSVIMRYTLRLLTAQQFERASQLIVALDFIRSENEDEIGKEKISIGLWIGEGTKNKLKDAKDNFNKMITEQSLSSALKINSFQVLKCPWCNQDHSIIPEEKNYRVKRKWGYSSIDYNGDYNMKCLNKKCTYSKGLPIYVVDEIIYKVRPTLLFGTVDKFAQIPLKEEANSIFGSDKLGRNRRPELIIQDELHLISGPLGSIVGLYEAGFDFIMKDTKEKFSPKYIASTATIRNAKEQVRGVFDRDVFQFPPNGISVSDNFFVKEEKKKLGRRYVGIMATGKSQITMEIRVIAAMLQVIENLNLTDKEKDLYWTIAGYFNSKRELGKAAGLIKDDVKEYINQLTKRNHMGKRYLTDDGSVELTSSVPGAEIPDILRKLEVSKSQSENKPNLKQAKPIDTLIATNMISVGIDIDRLNAMFVVGQPKLSAEYIQATSRVGRKALGLVFTLYNSMRSRDRSHYETFQTYHQSLYRFVESTSVTPYSVPALKKAISGVIVSMVRNTEIKLSHMNSANEVNMYNEKLIEIEQFLLERIARSEDSHKLYSKEAKKIISEFINEWKHRAETNESLLYYAHKTRTKDMKENILLRSYDDENKPDAIVAMQTMRNVEETSFFKVFDMR